jgi:molybdopterin-biosynthesis enzyme MoeA-like protein
VTAAPGVEKQVVRTAAALIIGSEILSGKVREANLFALGTTLRSLGILLNRAVVCPDDRDIISSEVRALANEHDVVFTSGGVGPTHDDVTVEGVAAALGLAVSVSPELAALLARVYGESLTETHLLMARIPTGALLMEGAQVRWPTVVAKNVWIMPGIPELFRMKLAVIREHLTGPEPFFSSELYLNAEEAEIKTLLDEVVMGHPRVEIGSYPKWADRRYKTLITFDGRDPACVELAKLEARDKFSRFVVSLS